VADPPRRRANNRKGHGTYETDRPPIVPVVGRESGTTRYFVRERTDAETCQGVVRSTVPAGASILYTDEWGGYARVESEVGTGHATVKHGKAGQEAREWARDDDGDGIREVHCNAACVPSSNVSRTVPLSPRTNSRSDAAFVSMTDRCTSLPWPLRTATTVRAYAL
jgi:transposase